MPPDAVTEKIKAALGGDRAALAEFGIRFNDETQRIAMNDLGLKGKFEQLSEADQAAVNTREILNATREEVMLTVQAANLGSTSLTNAQTRFSSSLANMKASIGETLAPAIMDMYDQISAAIPAVRDDITAVAESFSKIITDNTPSLIQTGLSFITNIIKPLGEALGSLSPGITTILDTLSKTVFPTLGDIIAQAGRIASALVPDQETIDGLLSPISTFFNGLIGEDGALAKAADTILSLLPSQETIGALLSPVQTIITGLFGDGEGTGIISSITSAAREISEKVVEPITGALSSIAQNLKEPLETAFSTISNIIDQVKGPVGNAVSAVARLMEKLAPVLKLLSPIVEFAGELLTLAINGIATVIEDIANGISALVGLFTGWRDRAQETVERAQWKEREDKAREAFRNQTGTEWNEAMYGANAQKYRLSNGAFDTEAAARDTSINRSWIDLERQERGYDSAWMSANFGPQKDWRGRDIADTLEAKTDEGRDWQKWEHDVWSGAITIDDATLARLRERDTLTTPGAGLSQAGLDSWVIPRDGMNGLLSAESDLTKGMTIPGAGLSQAGLDSWVIPGDGMNGLLSAGSDLTKSAGEMQTAVFSIANQTIPEAEASLAGFIPAIDSAAAALKAFSIRPGAANSGNLSAFASGTSNFEGGWLRMNEEGGELAFLPSGSAIIPADKTDAALSGADSYALSMNVTINGGADDTTIQRMREEMRRAFEALAREHGNRQNNRLALQHALC
jgi:phage-related protein